MSTLPDFEHALTFAIPMVGGVGDGSAREGMLIEWPQGWGEFSPLGDDDRQAARADGGDRGRHGRLARPGAQPDPGRRQRARDSAGPCARARRQRQGSHRRGRDLGAPDSLGDDVARVERCATRSGRRHRPLHSSWGWDVDTAVAGIVALERAADGLEYVEQPCLAADEFAAVRRKVDVRIAVDVSTGHAHDPPGLSDAADVVVLKSGPLGGVRRALRVAESSDLPCVVSSSWESSVGLAGGLALAGALPELRSRMGWAPWRSSRVTSSRTRSLVASTDICRRADAASTGSRTPGPVCS